MRECEGATMRAEVMTFDAYAVQVELESLLWDGTCDPFTKGTKSTCPHCGGAG